MIKRTLTWMILFIMCLIPAFTALPPGYMKYSSSLQPYAAKSPSDDVKTLFLQNNGGDHPAAVFSGADALSTFSGIATAQSAAHIMLDPSDVFFSDVHTDIPYLSMTFDDCPLGNTADILDALKEYGMRATFFVMGKYALNDSDMIERIVSEGHTIANHTYNHLALTSISRDKLQWQIEYTESVVFDTTGTRTILFRPPYGLTARGQMTFIATLGYSTVLWSVDSEDYISPEKSVGLAMEAGPGDIVLFHTGASTGDTIRQICKYYSEQGLMSVPVEELMALALADKKGVEELRNEEIIVN